ncbi:peptidoglycan endopeptidase [Luteolibacter algae]|uniref:Peptidoglycan endopeptidase n=1 Tax=Luteolibacter algae TaxID=454151 RepID=A0ABW5D9S5_9BACT
MKSFSLLALLVLPAVCFLSSCSSQVKAKQPVSYRFDHGRTAMIKNGIAYAPKGAPAAVKKAIAAGNRLQSKPYKWGGGHAKFEDTGYDCSGTTSYVLREAGLLKGCLTSKGFFEYGKKGEGKWITVYVRNGHVFMTVAGLRLDTGGSGARSGPRWKTATRNGHGHVMRHPSGL